MKPIHYYIIILICAIFLLPGCEIKDTRTPTQPDEEPVYVTVLTSGRVTSPAPGRIAVEDDSSTIPANEIAQVQWVVRAPTGSSADSGTTAPGGELTFTGLPAGGYTVEQTAILKSGYRGPTKTYDATVL
jgi:hypothetical protein